MPFSGNPRSNNILLCVLIYLSLCVYIYIYMGKIYYMYSYDFELYLFLFFSRVENHPSSVFVPSSCMFVNYQ